MKTADAKRAGTKSDPPVNPPAVQFAYTADKDGIVHLDEALGTPVQNSIAVAINIKVTQPFRDTGPKEAQLSVVLSTMPFAAMIYNATENADLFSKKNIKAMCDTALEYRDGCPCVYPLDANPCDDGTYQMPAPLDPQLPGSVFQVTGTLGPYKKGEQVSGFVVLVVESTS